MKISSLKKLTAVLLASSFFIFCSKDNGTDAQGTFFCKVNGKDYKPKFVTGYQDGITQTILVTGATGSNSEQVQFHFPGNITAGTYTQLNDYSSGTFISVSYSPAHSEEAGDDGIAKTGGVVITEHNTSAKRIKGTFHFISAPSINAGTIWNITDGNFDVKY